MIERIRFEPSDQDVGTQARKQRTEVDELLRSGVSVEALMNSRLAAATDEYFKDASAYHPGDETLPERLRRLDGEIT